MLRTQVTYELSSVQEQLSGSSQRLNVGLSPHLATWPHRPPRRQEGDGCVTVLFWFLDWGGIWGTPQSYKALNNYLYTNCKPASPGTITNSSYTVDAWKINNTVDTRTPGNLINKSSLSPSLPDSHTLSQVHSWIGYSYLKSGGGELFLVFGRPCVNFSQP